MNEPALPDLKIAILEAIATAYPGHVHKVNLIGRPYGPGVLENRLRGKFNAAQRALAGQAFEQLKQADLIRATYRDTVDPENWVEITEAGLQALEAGALDALDTSLKKIELHLLEIRRGAWSALVSGKPDSLRQAAHSGRELIDQILRIGAPDAEIKAEPGFVSDPDSQSGITRRMRLKVVMRKYRGSVSDSDLAVADKACELVLVVDDKLKGLAHARSAPSAEDVRDALQAAEIALRRILLSREPES